VIGPLSTDLAPAPTLHSERLVLRPLVRGDAYAIAEQAGDRRVAKSLADVPSPFPVAMAMSWVTARLDRWARGGGPTYAITERTAGPGLIGTVSMRSVPRDRRAELGYWLGYPSWGRGLASEAVQRIMRWAFVESDLHRVYAQVIAGNRRSQRVLEKAGMTPEGTRRGHLRKGRRFVDVDQYGVLRDEWLHHHGLAASASSGG
jgi:[ribosomal protein S5]-alanine N-acetyltransferase